MLSLAALGKVLGFLPFGRKAFDAPLKIVKELLPENNGTEPVNLVLPKEASLRAERDLENFLKENWYQKGYDNGRIPGSDDEFFKEYKRKIIANYCNLCSKIIDALQMEISQLTEDIIVKGNGTMSGPREVLENRKKTKEKNLKLWTDQKTLDHTTNPESRCKEVIHDYTLGFHQGTMDLLMQR